MNLTEAKPGHWLATGELTFATSADSWPRLLDCLRATAVQVDVSRLTRVDSAGLATLVAWQAEAGRRGVAVQLLGANEQLLQLARVGGIDGVLPLQWPADSAATG